MRIDRTDGKAHTCTRGPDEQAAFRDLGAHRRELLWLFQELHDFHEVVLGLLDASHVVKRDAGVGLHLELGLGLAKLQAKWRQSTAAACMLDCCNAGDAHGHQHGARVAQVLAALANRHTQKRATIECACTSTMHRIQGMKASVAKGTPAWGCCRRARPCRRRRGARAGTGRRPAAAGTRGCR